MYWSNQESFEKAILGAVNHGGDADTIAAITGSIVGARFGYDSIPKSSGGFIRVPKKTLDYTIIVVDEVSMVPKSMIDMLLAHRVYVIFLGDPFQLPQIDKNEGHDLLDHPHIFLKLRRYNNYAD